MRYWVYPNPIQGTSGCLIVPEDVSITNNYFTNTLPTLDRAYLRPRYCGYLEFQDNAGPIVHEHLRGKIDAKETLQRLNTLYSHSLQSI